MYFGAVTSVVLISTFIGALSTSRDGHGWFDRLEVLGITAASVVVEYSVTDTCELSIVDARSASPEEFFVDGTIAEMIAEIVGPTDSEETKPLRRKGIEFPTLTEPSKYIRLIRWYTPAGHQYIKCTFLIDGSLETAEHIHGSIAPAETLAPARIEARLSTLESRVLKLVVEFEG